VDGGGHDGLLGVLGASSAVFEVVWKLYELASDLIAFQLGMLVVFLFGSVEDGWKCPLYIVGFSSLKHRS